MTVQSQVLICFGFVQTKSGSERGSVVFVVFFGFSATVDFRWRPECIRGRTDETIRSCFAQLIGLSARLAQQSQQQRSKGSGRGLIVPTKTAVIREVTLPSVGDAAGAAPLTDGTSVSDAPARLRVR